MWDIFPILRTASKAFFSEGFYDIRILIIAGKYSKILKIPPKCGANAQRCVTHVSAPMCCGCAPLMLPVMPFEPPASPPGLLPSRQIPWPLLLPLRGQIHAHLGCFYSLFTLLQYSFPGSQITCFTLPVMNSGFFSNVLSLRRPS